ncbi:MAG: Ig-like domain-containing protein [Thermodesulfovibrionales bacterium]|nr:Ig-like domain-containing protein [Thermodesulfovibrionales bacterium]
MKKVFIIMALLAFALSFAGCGGGGGSMDSPKGENPGKATLVELTPSHFVSHTNSDITLHAKVLDGNGNPVKNKPVRFTNLSPVGVLDKITDKTDANGIATVTLHSHEVGFATIQAEVDEGLNQVRDRIIIYYSNFALMWPQPTIVLDIDADNDGIYNETSDFNFFEIPTDDNATLRATAYDEFGKRIVGMSVTFSGDSGASFPLGDTFMTNSAGQAFAYLKVSPTSVVGQETSLLIQAVGANGSADSITIFLQPVFITGILLNATPTGVIAGETSAITATITTSAGTIPDDLAVQFSVNPVTLGTVSPVVALTSNGVASAVFTPSDTQTGTATVTASIANFTATADIVVTTEFAVTPDSQTLTNPAVGDTATYAISGGVAPYNATSNNTALVTVGVAGTTLTATVAALPTADTDVEITITDSSGRPPVTVTLTIAIEVTPLVFLPPTATASCSGAVVTFFVSGGIAPYTAISTHGGVIIAGNPIPAGGFFTATTACPLFADPSSTAVAIIVTDSAPTPQHGTITLTVTRP